MASFLDRTLRIGASVALAGAAGRDGETEVGPAVAPGPAVLPFVPVVAVELVTVVSELS